MITGSHKKCNSGGAARGRGRGLPADGRRTVSSANLIYKVACRVRIKRSSSPPANDAQHAAAAAADVCHCSLGSFTMDNALRMSDTQFITTTKLHILFIICV